MYIVHTLIHKSYIKYKYEYVDKYHLPTLKAPYPS